jgi:hypothetical protein
MTAYIPPDEAVQAAAKVIWENTDEPGWSAVVIARAALAAAAPIIEREAGERIAREIEDFEPEDRALVHMPDWREAMYDAARIARGDTP